MGTVVHIAALLLLAFAASAAPRLTSPKAFLGFNLGDDYQLPNYTQLATYWERLDRESDRLKVVPIGLTEEGRTMVMGIVTSPANHRRLYGFKDTVRRLALGEATEADARRLAEEGRAVLWIDGGLHATETLGFTQLMETLWQFVSRDDAETRRILDDCIILFVPANPDGMELVANWYMREADPKKRSFANLPRLYQKYIGHDNNRDFFACVQSESKTLNRILYREWFPQILYNHHQSGPQGTVMFAPPFRDPANYNVDPLVTSGIDAVGAAMMQRFLAEGKPGVTVRSGARYSTWWNGGLRTTAYFHNQIGLLTETIGSPTPMTIPFLPDKLLPKADYLAPIAPQRWHFRSSVDYSVTANYAVLDYASRQRSTLLLNAWRMARTAIERGGRDSWTVSPKDIERAVKERKGSPFLSNAATNEFKRLLQDPAKRDARAYILPANQRDFPTATKFVNTLLETGVQVHRATADFTVGTNKFPTGSYVVKCAQPFRAHVLDMFEPQDHPNDFPYPGAAPTAPYDIAGWTLAFQMGVKFERVLEGMAGPFEEVSHFAKPIPGRIQFAEGALAFSFESKVNNSFQAANCLLALGDRVVRTIRPGELHWFGPSNQNHFFRPDPGLFIVKVNSNTVSRIRSLAEETGVSFRGMGLWPGPKPELSGVVTEHSNGDLVSTLETPVKGGGAVLRQRITIPAGITNRFPELRMPRIGLWDRYGGSMPSGWTRWVLERFEFPFQVVFPPELDRGNLREKFDVLLFVDGAIPAFTRGSASVTNTTSTTPAPTGDAPADTSAEYRGQRGSVTVAKTIPQLRKFLEDGGTILTIGSSTSLARHLGLPVESHLTEPDKEDKPRPLPREKFYVPGSVLRARVDTAHPLAWGMEPDVDVFFQASPVFRFTDKAGPGQLDRVAWFNSKAPLRSGWAWGQEHLDNGIAIAEVRVGKGRLVLFGPEIAFRAQPHGTFKFLFNGLWLPMLGDAQ
ncbi:MAG: M14 metallopeptidase family protein [Limisphaerales bacterium]